MPSQTKAQALEAAIEKRLTGICLEELKLNSTLSDVHEQPELYRSGHGFCIGLTDDFNPRYAIDETRFWQIVAAAPAGVLP